MFKSSFLLGFSFLISKFLGLVRDHLLASNFGTSAGIGIFNLDTYYAAFRLPDLLYNLLSYGVLSAAFVPLFTEILKKEGRGSAFRFSNEILQAWSIVILIVSAVLWVAAPTVMKFFVPGFTADDFSVTVTLARIMLVTPFFFTLGSIAGGIQNALHRFLGLALAPIFYNLGIIGGILFLSGSYGVAGVAMGVVAGAFLHAAVLFIGAFHLGYRPQKITPVFTPRVWETIRLALPRIFGMSVTQLSLLIDTVIASTLSMGSISIINFASNLESLPIGVIGISMATVSFGTLSAHAAEKNYRAFRQELFRNLRRIFILLLPLAAGMFFLRFHLVNWLLAYGKFSQADATLTANTLGIFLVGLCFGGVVFLLARAFYALKDTRTPVVVGICSVAVNIGISLLSTKVFLWGTYGLAAANSAADIMNCILLMFLLHRRLKKMV